VQHLLWNAGLGKSNSNNINQKKTNQQMKKLIVAGVMAIGVFNASAQNKIGYISTDELIAVMPEAEKADAELKEYQAALGEQGQERMATFTAKDSAFAKDSSKYSPSMKEIKRKELFELYQKVQGFQTEAQEMYQQEAQKKIAPIRAKAMDAIRVVAKESGYTYIFDINAVIVAPPGDDVLPLVKKKLGIKEAAPAPAPVKKTN
jgi:outer membrane protein